MTLTLMRESWILIGICVTDLVVTLALLTDPGVREGNPLMRYYLEHGTGLFITVKILLVVMPLFIAEYSKQFRPLFVRSALRLTIAAYLATYFLLFAGINLAPLAQGIAHSHVEQTSIAAVPTD